VLPEISQKYRAIVVRQTGAWGAAMCLAALIGLQLWARDAVAVMDAAGIESAHVMGASMGGDDRGRNWR